MPALITEAGDLAGETDYLNTGNCIAGNPKIFAQLLQVIGNHKGSKLPD